MQKNKTAKTFREEYDQRIRLKAINECSWFGIVWGLVLALAATYWAACTVGVFNIMFKVAAVLGFLLVTLGIFAPLLIKKLTDIIRKSFSAVGNIILKIILLPIYLIMTAVNAFTGKKYSAEFGFKNWEERSSAFTAYSDFNSSSEGEYKHTITGTVIKVLGFFVNNRMFVVVPIVVLLLIFGMIMFFASSSTVLSFVYTLF